MNSRALGFRYLDAKDYRQAEISFRTELVSAPTSSSFLNGLAIALYQQGFSSEALDYARKATVLERRHVAYLHNFAIIGRDCGQWNEAEDAIRMALESAPWNARLHSILGQILTLDGKLVEAENAIREALMLRPDAAQYREQLADLLLANNQPREAEVHYRRAASLSPENDRFSRKHQELLYKLGEDLSAVQSYLQAVERYPDDPLALLDLAEFYLREKSPDQAKSLCERALELVPSFSAARERVKKCHLMNGRGEDGGTCLDCLDGGHSCWGSPDYSVVFCCGCNEELEGNDTSDQICCNHRYVGDRLYDFEDQAGYHHCMDCDQLRSVCTCFDSDEDEEDEDERKEIEYHQIDSSVVELVCGCDRRSIWDACVCYIYEIDPDEPVWEDENL